MTLVAASSSLMGSRVKALAEATTTAVRALRALHSNSAAIFVRKRGEGSTCPRTRRVRGVLGQDPRSFHHRNAIKALGDASDKILLKLPAKAAEKLVALQVEAASSPVFTILSELRKFLGGRKCTHSALDLPLRLPGRRTLTRCSRISPKASKLVPPGASLRAAGGN